MFKRTCTEEDGVQRWQVTSKTDKYSTGLPTTCVERGIRQKNGLPVTMKWGTELKDMSIYLMIVNTELSSRIWET